MHQTHQPTTLATDGHYNDIRDINSVTNTRTSSYGHRRLVVLAREDYKELLELPLQCLESRTLHRVHGPALEHDLVHRAHADSLWRTRHAISVLHLVQYFRIPHT
jgi:hypothetical protein